MSNGTNFLDIHKKSTRFLSMFHKQETLTVLTKRDKESKKLKKTVRLKKLYR